VILAVVILAVVILLQRFSCCDSIAVTSSLSPCHSEPLAGAPAPRACEESAVPSATPEPKIPKTKTAQAVKPAPLKVCHSVRSEESALTSPPTSKTLSYTSSISIRIGPKGHISHLYFMIQINNLMQKPPAHPLDKIFPIFRDETSARAYAPSLRKLLSFLFF
jgi:hypothetical protein